MKEPRAGRRPLLIGLVGGAAALGATTTAAKIGSTLQDPALADGRPALQLSADSPTMSSLSVRLDDRLLPRGSSASWLSPGLRTSTHSMVGVTWRGDHHPRLRVRSRIDGRWTGWRSLPGLHDSPDMDSHEASAVRGTQLVWTGNSDGIQVQLDDEPPPDLTLVLLHPARLAGDAAVATTVRSATVTTAEARAAAGKTPSARVPRPALLTRADWGADESWREWPPRYNHTIQQAHVHHTASGNDYTQDDVAAIIRGFYRYHTGALGWSDIAYNFLVDKFGRTWVGRAGGPARPVRGAHTLGFNATSVGISVIGNFDTAAPGKQVLRAVAAVAAWKLHPYGRDPQAWVRVDSEGSDKFRAGRVVPLPVIDGHRDTNDTACPGQHLYQHLPGIRRRAQAMITRAETPPSVDVTTPSTVTGNPLVGQTLIVTPGAFTPDGTVSSCTWLRDGVAILGATATTYQVAAADLGAKITVQVTTSKGRHAPAVELLTVPGAVRATTLVTARARPRVLKAVVHVRVHAVGSDIVPTGSVTVTLRQRRQTVRLSDGVAVARFTGLRAGRAAATVSYPGAGHLVAAQTTIAVVVKPRRS